MYWCKKLTALLNALSTVVMSWWMNMKFVSRFSCVSRGYNSVLMVSAIEVFAH